uniref:Putative secreted protein n=1 Tax=Ixodes scapularis TaxID=6945 RepID=A0A4D5RBK1_IXOSC
MILPLIWLINLAILQRLLQTLELLSLSEHRRVSSSSPTPLVTGTPPLTNQHRASRPRLSGYTKCGATSQRKFHVHNSSHCNSLRRARLSPSLGAKDPGITAVSLHHGTQVHAISLVTAEH